jgi:thymidine phosphorylase
LRPLGTKVEAGEPFAFVHAASGDQAEKARARLVEIYAVGDETPAGRPTVLSRISG